MKENHHLNRISFIDMLKICLYRENSGYIYVMIKSKQFLHQNIQLHAVLQCVPLVCNK